KRSVEETVYHMFTWRKGTFEFKSSLKIPRQSLPVTLRAESLLLESGRRVDEWSEIRKKVASLDLVYRRTIQRFGAVELSPEQQRVFPLLDGVRDVNAIIALSGLSEFETARALYALVIAGLAQFLDRRTDI